MSATQSRPWNENCITQAKQAVSSSVGLPCTYCTGNQTNVSIRGHVLRGRLPPSAWATERCSSWLACCTSWEFQFGGVFLAATRGKLSKRTKHRHQPLQKKQRRRKPPQNKFASLRDRATRILMAGIRRAALVCPWRTSISTMEMIALRSNRGSRIMIMVVFAESEMTVASLHYC